MIRLLLFISILVLVIISIGGYITLSFGWLPDNIKNIYNSQFSFITGLASVIGLLAFLSSKKIRSTDFENEELEKLKKLMDTAEKLATLEKNKSQTAKELQNLEKKRKLLEISVRKAGLVLFYQNQNEKYSRIVIDKINKDTELKSAIQEVKDSSDRLLALKEEISNDENIEIINEILIKCNEDQRSIPNDPITMFVGALGESVTNIMKILRI